MTSSSRPSVSETSLPLPLDAGETPVRAVRVLPDVAGLNKRFDYAVPDSWVADGRSARLAVGDRVRVVLQGRRVGGWIVELDITPEPGVALKPLAKWSGRGPAADVIALAEWAASRWAGLPARVLRSATPNRIVSRIPEPKPVVAAGESSWLDQAFDGRGAVVRLGPAADRWPVVEAALRCGNPLFVFPAVEQADRLVTRLRRGGTRAALVPRDWAQAAGGAAVAGGRAAAFAPAPLLGCVVVFDEHDESLQDERTPTWHARDVAVERARRSGVPCVLVSPIPSLEALQTFALMTESRIDEFDAWPSLVVIDRREEPPGKLGLFSRQLVDELRSERRVACILNRTGRSRLLACGTCGELTLCVNCLGAMVQSGDDATLSCSRCEHERPSVCAECGASRLKNIRMGVSRAREEIDSLISDVAAEVTASAWVGPDEARVVVGTEALLHRGLRFDTVAFCDFDQELAARRQRAGEQSLALLARAARIVGSRANGGRVLVQTRRPEHPTLAAARRADPAVFSAAEDLQRQQMRWPPYCAQASISGIGGERFVASLPASSPVTVVGSPEAGWLARATDHEALLAVLERGDRSGGRLRVAVDPLRV